MIRTRNSVPYGMPSFDKHDSVSTSVSWKHSKSRKRDATRFVLTFLCGVIFWWRLSKLFAPIPESNPGGWELKAEPSALEIYQNINPLSMIHQSSKNAVLPNHRAVVTTLYTNAYVFAIATLGHSLQKANIKARRIVVYLPDRISARSLCLLKAAGWETHPVDLVPPPHDGKDIHHFFKDQYTKLSIWTLDQLGIKTVIYLDADTLVVRNFDELWDIPFEFAAVPDVYLGHQGFSIGYNAGVMLLHPSTDVFRDMVSKLETAEFRLWDAEQSFLNLYFGVEAVRLPYSYNGNLAIKARSTEMWNGMQTDLRIVHFTLVKPFRADPKCEGSEPNCDLDRLLFDAKERKRYIQEQKQQWDGRFAAEIGWWEDTYDSVMNEIRNVCLA